MFSVLWFEYPRSFSFQFGSQPDPDTRAHVSQAVEMVSMAATDYLATREQKQKPPVNLHCINDPSLALARNPCS